MQAFEGLLTGFCFSEQSEAHRASDQGFRGGIAAKCRSLLRVLEVPSFPGFEGRASTVGFAGNSS